MKLEDVINIASAGMRAQAARLRVAAENMANASSTASTPGGDPYQRKTISFEEQLDRERGVKLVDVARYGVDKTPFPKEYDPAHPAADDKGYVQMPNVNPLVEIMDMREAQRSYEANLNAMSLTRAMSRQTIDLLR